MTDNCSITLGTVVDRPAAARQTLILPAVPELEPYLHNESFLADVARRYECPLNVRADSPGEVVTLGGDILATSVFITGHIGTGKSRTQNAAVSQLIRQGWSAIVVDPMRANILGHVPTCRECGLPPERLTVISEQIPDACPRFPALWDRDLAPRALAAILTELCEGIAGSDGVGAPRRKDLTMRFAQLVMGEGDGRFSLDELHEALFDPDVREALARQPGDRVDPFGWRQVQRMVTELRRWSKSMAAEGMAPVSRLLRSLTSTPTLFGMLCATPEDGKPMLRLADHWREQHVTLVHTHTDAAGKVAMQVALGLLLRRALATARTVHSASRRVVLSLDELPELATLIADDLGRTIRQGRQLGLSIIASAQYVSALPEEVQASLSLVGASIAFRTGFAEAKELAVSLVAGQPRSASQVTIAPDVARRDDPWRYSVVNHPILASNGQVVRIRSEVWQQLSGRYRLSGIPLQDLLVRARKSGIPRLWVMAPVSQQPVQLQDYVRSLAPCTWYIDGPQPLRLVVSVPRAKITQQRRESEGEVISRVAQAIFTLRTQHAVVSVQHRVLGIVRMAHSPDPVFRLEDQEYLQAALRINGQTTAEILALADRRTRNIEELRQGGSIRQAEVSDGSRW